jgi:hypothetical protein
MATNYSPDWKDGLSPYQQGLKRAQEEFKRKYPSGHKPSNIQYSRAASFPDTIKFGSVVLLICALVSIFFLWGVHVLVQ